MSNSKQPIVLVLASDQGYFEGLWVTLISLMVFTNTKRHIKIYIMDGGIEKASKKQLQKQLHKINNNFEIKWLIADIEKFKSFKSMNNSYVCYSRILIPEIIVEPKVIWLDVDLLVLKDIELLWEVDLHDSAIGACLEAPKTLFKNDVDNLTDFHIPEDSSYFNSGVLLMNNDALRKINFASHCFDFLVNNKGHYKWWDQSAINVVCYNQIKELDRSFNQLNTLKKGIKSDLELLKNGGYIYHFLQNPKPWQRYSTRLHAQLMYRIAAWTGLKFEKLNSRQNNLEKLKRKFPLINKQYHALLRYRNKTTNEVAEIAIKNNLKQKKDRKTNQNQIDQVFEMYRDRFKKLNTDGS